MGKPFDKELARDAEAKTRELVQILNRYLKSFYAELGPGKNSDVILRCKSNPKVEINVEVEIVRGDRWKKIVNEYPTVRWPIAKKEKCVDYSDRGKLLIMMSANRDNLSEIFFVDCDTWVAMGKEEKAPFVKAGGKSYRYRKHQEERFWAIGKNEVQWGIEKLETFLLDLLKRKNYQCR